MTATLPQLATHRVLGVDVQAIDTDTLLSLTGQIIEAGDRRIIANHHLHSVYLYHHDAPIRRFYKLADYVFIDGIPLVYMGMLLGLPLRPRHKITSIDWLPLLLAAGVPRGWRTFLLGGRATTVTWAAAELTRRIPGVQLETAPGYFDATPGSPGAEAVLKRINDFRPHLLCVGMGMPRQEHWIADHFERLEANVVFNLGGFLELLSGELPTPPRWTARANLEWLYRLVTRPRRVWRRYLLEPWALAPLALRDLSGRIRGSG